MGTVDTVMARNVDAVQVPLGAAPRVIADRLSDAVPVAILGAPGAGKTTAVRSAATLAGLDLLEGGCLDSLSWQPYLPLRRALGATATEGDPDQVALNVVFGTGTRLLFIDDVQWADDDTRKVLQGIAGEVRLVLAMRLGHADDELRQWCDELGATTLALSPLGDDDARALVARCAPGLSPEEIRSVVERGLGNPLLLTELARHGRIHPTFRVSVLSRVAALDDGAQRALSMLALADRPLSGTTLGDHVPALTEAELVVERDGWVELPHRLFGEVIVADLEAGAIRHLHQVLARTAEHTDPGAAARHWAAAGERQDALRTARVAATRSSHPHERAAHLLLAAQMADGTAAEVLRVEAAEALTSLSDSASVLELLGDLPTDRSLAARATWCLARACVALGDRSTAEAWLSRGLALVDDDALTETRLKRERAHVALHTRPLEALPLAIEADELARRSGHEVARTAATLAQAHGASASPDWRTHYDRARDLAEAEGDVELFLRLAKATFPSEAMLGDPALAGAQAREAARLARDAGRPEWEHDLLGEALFTELYAFGRQSALEELQALVAQPTIAPNRRYIDWCIAMALADQGRDSEARMTLAVARAQTPPGDRVYESMCWALSETELIAGHAKTASEIAREASKGLKAPEGYIVGPMLRLTLLWAQLATHQPARDAGVNVLFPSQQAAVHEGTGLEALAKGDHRGAAAAFDLASTAWQGRFARGVVRCRWAAGASALWAGDRDDGVAWLLEADDRGSELDMVPAVRLVRRTLRAAGVSRPRVRSTSPDGTTLSAREREVLDLVAQGRPSREIAALLGIQAKTVDTLVGSAMLKLGARTRIEAVARHVDHATTG